jgi:hypothetical protein
VLSTDLSTLPAAQAATLTLLLDRERWANPPRPGTVDVFAPTWRNSAMADFAVGHVHALVGDFRFGGTRAAPGNEVVCSLWDQRGRHWELRAGFESRESGRLVQLCVLPTLEDHVAVRAPRPSDMAAMTQLELSAPIRRADGSEVLIEHNGQQFVRSSVVSDHRWLAAFRDECMLAVQGVTLATAPIAGKWQRIAYNHYSRSDPSSRQSGNLLHLVSRLYWDIYPQIDQFISLVDVQNSAGLRLSFGVPWPTKVLRLFIPVESLAQRRSPGPNRQNFDAGRAAALLNSTHDGLQLWVPRTAGFLLERCRRAPTIYGDGCWRMSEHAVLALWPSGERRTYRNPGGNTTRTLALALDYGFEGETGRAELTGLLHEAARQLRGSGISHIAMFVPEHRPSCDWLAQLADGVDTYAICSSPTGTLPDGPVYVDQVVF